MKRHDASSQSHKQGSGQRSEQLETPSSASAGDETSEQKFGSKRKPSEAPDEPASAGPAASVATREGNTSYGIANPADLDALVNQLPGAVYRCTYDTSWTSFYMGEGFKQICGIDPQSLDPSGRSFKEVIHPDDLDRIRRAVGRAVRNHTYYSVEYRIESDDGETRWVQDNGRPAFNDDGSVKWLDGILLDVTDRERAQQHLTEAEARTMRLRKLSAKLTMAEQRERSQIATSMHDDLLQYLYGIQVQIRMLVEGIQDLSEADWETLPVSPGRVDELMNEAIDAARRLTVDLAPPVLESDGIIESLQWLRTHLEKHHEFDVEIDSEINDIPCLDEICTVLFRATRELLLNACEHAGVDSAQVRVYAKNDALHVDVTDEGIGFDPDAVLNRDSDGRGLWKVRERLRSVDGTLHIDTAPHEGTRCSMKVPLRASDLLESDAELPK